MKKIVLASIAALVLFTGCDNSNQSKVAENVQTRSEAYTVIATDMKVFCDKEKGVEYLVFDDYKQDGMTIRTNADGSVSTCKE